MMNKRRQTFKYILCDYLLSLLSWSLFFCYRKSIFFSNFQATLDSVFNDKNFYIGLIIIPIAWVILYAIIGSYRKIFRRSRLRELTQVFIATFIGVTVIFFLLILDDVVISYKDYYKFYLFLFFVHLALISVARFILTTITNKKIHKGLLSFSTLLVGNNGSAKQVYDDIKNQAVSSGNNLIGYVKIVDEEHDMLKGSLPCLGNVSDIEQIVSSKQVEELIIAIDPAQHKLIENILLETNRLKKTIKIIPGDKDIIAGNVKYHAILNVPLIELPDEIMPYWQKLAKRLFDVCFSVIALILLIPVYVFLIIGVKRSSKGSIFYSHTRIGIFGKPFKIYKFRSMVVDAEKSGTPQLSNKHDPRVTTFGRFMRKYRLDELPQFYNVLIGDMSLVGPRPERQYYIDQIVKQAPQYHILHKVKPGITSLGQVKFGYAENVEEMIQRMRFDLLYIENMSLAMDIKIMFYTILIVVKGSGK